MPEKDHPVTQRQVEYVFVGGSVGVVARHLVAMARYAGKSKEEVVQRVGMAYDKMKFDSPGVAQINQDANSPSFGLDASQLDSQDVDLFGSQNGNILDDAFLEDCVVDYTSTLFSDDDAEKVRQREVSTFFYLCKSARCANPFTFSLYLALYGTNTQSQTLSHLSNSSSNSPRLSKKDPTVFATNKFMKMSRSSSKKRTHCMLRMQ